MPCGVASSVDLDASSHSPVELEIEPRASCVGHDWAIRHTAKCHAPAGRIPFDKIYFGRGRAFIL